MNSAGWTYAVRVLVLALAAAGCAPDAPHDNPLDPASPSFSGTGLVRGVVSLLSNPGQGIPSAQICLLPSGPIVLSAADGSYSFPLISSGPAELAAAKDGFRTDTARIRIDPGGVTLADFRLDALPSVSRCTIVTQKLDAFFPGPLYLASITAEVTDPDGMADLDSVWYSVGNVTRDMSFNPDSHLYEASLFEYELPTNNINWLVGKEVRIHCADDQGATASAGNLFVTRIIEECATPVSPAPSDTAEPTPLLEWVPADVTFRHTLTLQIVHQLSGTQTVMWTESGVDPDLWSLRCPLTLLSGSYFWTIAVVDEFGNMSRGKPVSFLVL